MRVLVESSAVLAWLFGEPDGPAVARALEAAEVVVASRLTLLECERTIVRAERQGEIDAAAAVAVRSALASVAVHWTVVDVTNAILAKACGPFPREPFRTLDAIHVATAEIVRSVEPIATLVSLDERVRGNATLLGFELAPSR